MISIITLFFLFTTAYGSFIALDTLGSIIEEVNSRNTTWKAGHNFHPDTPISFLKRLMGAKENPENELLRKVRYHYDLDLEIPEAFDSRDHWPYCPTIREIRDQGNCGSCWAVAAAAAFSDRYCIATNGTFTMPLSDEDLLSCCNICGDGCDGGYIHGAWKYFEEYGIVTGGGYNSLVGCQPYEIEPCEHHIEGKLPRCRNLPDVPTPQCKYHCTNLQYSPSYYLDSRKIDEAYSVTSDVMGIQKEIMLHGPVEASLTVYADFTTYTSGVFQHIYGKMLGEHAVKIIGWGVESIPYWLVANSWNTEWGDQGFFKIWRGVNHCGIEEGIVAGIPKVQ